jgi:phage head maturation protease
LTRELDSELEMRSESDRIVSARLLRWGEVAETPQGRERIVRGAFRGIDPTSVTLEAIGPHGADPGVRLAGRGVSITERDDGPHAELRVSRTAAGDELLELVRDRVYRRVSIVFAPVEGGSRVTDDGITERTAIELVRVGIVERGAYTGAEVLGVRSATVNETPNPEPEPTPTPTPPDPTPPGTGVTVLHRDGLEELRTDMLARMAVLEARPGAGSVGGPLARYASLVDYIDAAYGDALLGRVLANQLTTDSPGVIPPSWVQDIAGIIAFPRPGISANGGARSLGDTGMELDWPYLDPALNLDTIVAAQATEKTEITSVKVKILKGLSAIATYAGGSDVSYQLIRRSRPAYREAYVRILAIAYARTTEAAFEAAALAGATSSLVLTATATADQVRAFLFAASSLVNDATGAPATVDLVSPTEFNRLGGLAGLVPAPYGTSNVPGTATASTLRINVSGLEVIRAPFLPGNTHLVTNGEAVAWHEDGPFPISAEDVAKLGQNVAIWGMGTTAVYIPKGIVKSTLT